MSSSEVQFHRRPYMGSCHCKNVKYIVYLSLPDMPYPHLSEKEFREQSGHRLYKCNCTICQKMSIFHIRLLNAPKDFLLLTPGHPLAEGSGVTTYKCNAGFTDRFFCSKCGVLTFSMLGKLEEEEVEVPAALLEKMGLDAPNPDQVGNATVKVWHAAKGWKEHMEGIGGDNYMSINLASIEPYQDGFDLRQLHEASYISYLDALSGKQYEGWDEYEPKPYEGGMY